MSTSIANWASRLAIVAWLGLSSGALLAVGPTVSTTALLPLGRVGTEASLQLMAAEGTPPYRWELISYTSPTRLTVTLEPSGRLTYRALTPGQFDLRAMVHDGANQTASKDFSLLVTEVLSLRNPYHFGTVAVWQPLVAKLEVAGAMPPCKFAVVAGRLPPGIGLNRWTGELSGAAEEPGNYEFSIEVKDASGQSIRQVQKLRVGEPQGLAIGMGSELPSAIVGVSYTCTLEASGGKPPFAWSLGEYQDLAAGLVLKGDTGIVSGTPTKEGFGLFDAIVTDSLGATAQRRLSLRVVPAPTGQ